MSIAVGKPAPDFTMPTDGDGTISLSELKGKKVVLFFYPKDDTSGCTKEAVGFRDYLSDFEAAGATIVGVSKDPVKSHNKFVAKHELNFPLGSDAETEVAEAYEVWKEKSMYGRKYMGIERSTFLIDEEGVLREEWRKVKVPGHVEQVLKAVQAL